MFILDSLRLCSRVKEGEVHQYTARAMAFVSGVSDKTTSGLRRQRLIGTKAWLKQHSFALKELRDYNDITQRASCQLWLNQQGPLSSHTQGDWRSGAGMSEELDTCCFEEHQREREGHRGRGREEERDRGIFLFDSKQWEDFIQTQEP